MMNVFLAIATSVITLHLHCPATVSCLSSDVSSAVNISEAICSEQTFTNEVQSPRVLHQQSNGELPSECRHTTCFPKCCKIGEILQGRYCVPSDLIFDPYVSIVGEKGYNFTDLDTGSYYLVLGNPCRTWFEMGYDEIDVWCTGILTAYDYNWVNYTDYYANEYCLEYTENDTLAIICAELKVRNISSGHWSSSLMMLVSVTALLTTIVALLDTMLSLYDKAFLAFVGTQLVAYSILTVIRLTGRITFGYSACKYIGIVIQFFALKSFLWVHIMCFDTLGVILMIAKKCPYIYPAPNNFWTDCYRSISDDDDPKSYLIRGKTVKQMVVLVGYCVYVLFLSFLHLILIIIIGPSIPFTYTDDSMYLHGCEVNSFSAIYLFIIPLLITVLNIIIFTVIFLTRNYLSKIGVHMKIMILYKLWMNSLLFLLMTCIWTLEFLSMVFGGPEIIRVIRDIIYIIEGPLIFTIFRVVKSLQYVPRKIRRNHESQHSNKLDTNDLQIFE